jgi:hypothetical protein
MPELARLLLSGLGLDSLGQKAGVWWKDSSSLQGSGMAWAAAAKSNLLSLEASQRLADVLKVHGSRELDVANVRWPADDSICRWFDWLIVNLNYRWL